MVVLGGKRFLMSEVPLYPRQSLFDKEELPRIRGYLFVKEELLREQPRVQGYLAPKKHCDVSGCGVEPGPPAAV